MAYPRETAADERNSDKQPQVMEQQRQRNKQDDQPGTNKNLVSSI